jgi:hypothetical protein
LGGGFRGLFQWFDDPKLMVDTLRHATLPWYYKLSKLLEKVR